MRIAFATCADLPEGDADDALLVEALAARGADVAWRRWDDGGVEWSSYDAVLLRSTWDYQGRRDEFLAWSRQVPRLLNPYEVIEWNTDKRYLAELAAAGLSVIDTEFVASGEEPPGLPVSEEVVVKPSVSAGSRDTARFSLADPAERAAARGLIGSIQASGRTAMLQPFMRRVDDNGETALIYFGGEFSHSARKGPLLVPGAGPTEELFAAETIEPRQATDAERDLADRVVAWIGRRSPLGRPRPPTRGRSIVAERTGMSLKRTDLQRLADILPGAFYAVMGIAFLSLLLGSPGAAMLFLIVGALVHVARVGVEYTLGMNLRRR